MCNGNMAKQENTREKGIWSDFCNSQIRCADRDTSVALHQDGEQTKQEGCITTTDNTLPIKII